MTHQDDDPTAKLERFLAGIKRRIAKSTEANAVPEMRLGVMSAWTEEQVAQFWAARDLNELRMLEDATELALSALANPEDRRRAVAYLEGKIVQLNGKTGDGHTRH